MVMNKVKMMDLLIDRIKSCHEQFLVAKNNQYPRTVYIEGFRCRLDELILFYHTIRDISFVEACKELEIEYEDLNFVDHKKWN